MAPLTPSLLRHRLAGIALAGLLGASVLTGATTTFERYYLHPDGYADYFWKVEVRPEGGYLTDATYTASPHVYSGFGKYDSLGNLLWFRGHDPRPSLGAGTTAICIGRDGDYFLAGLCGGYTGDLYFIKTDTACNLIWLTFYEGPGFEGTYSDLCPTADSGCAYTGYITTDEGGGLGVIKLSRDGEIEWFRLYEPPPTGSGVSIHQTPDRGYFVGGQVYVPGSSDSAGLYIIRTGERGDTLWTRAFYGYGNSIANGGCLTRDGGFAMCGASLDRSGLVAISGYIVRVDSAGNLLWERHLSPGHPLDTHYYLRQMVQTPDGGFAVTGEWFDFTGPERIGSVVFLRLDSLGEPLWRRFFYGRDTTGQMGMDLGMWVENTPDNGFVIAGGADGRRRGYLIKTDSLGLVHYCDLRLSDWRFNDAAGNGNGRPDPGETAGLIVTYANSPGFWDADRIRATLSTTSTGVTIIKDTATFPPIPAGSSGDCSADSFVVSVAAGTPPQDIRFHLTVTARPDVRRPDTGFAARSGIPRTLIVDDDLGLGYERYFTSACDSNRIVYDLYQTEVSGPPTSDTLRRYAVVIWNTGNDSVTSLTVAEQAALEGYLSAGGSLLLSGKKVAQNLRGSSFLADWLRAAPAVDTMGRLILVGRPGDPIAEGDTMVIAGAGGAANGADANGIRPINGAVGGALYRDYPDTTVQGLIHYRGDYRLVFFAAPFEAINLSPARYLQRWTLISRIYRFFGEATPGAEEPAPPLPAADRPGLVVMPNPFARTARVRFTSPVPGPVRLALYNAAGQLVHSESHATGKPGPVEFLLDGTRLNSGIYIVRATSPAGTLSARVAVLR